MRDKDVEMRESREKMIEMIEMREDDRDDRDERREDDRDERREDNRDERDLLRGGRGMAPASTTPFTCQQDKPSAVAMSLSGFLTLIISPTLIASNAAILCFSLRIQSSEHSSPHSLSAAAATVTTSTK